MVTGNGLVTVGGSYGLDSARLQLYAGFGLVAASELDGLILAEGQHNRVIVIQNRFGDEAAALPENWTSLSNHYEKQGLILEKPVSVNCWKYEGFDALEKQIRRSLEDMQEEREYQLPPSWATIREDLLGKREQGEKTLGYDDFIRSCQETHGISEESVAALLRFLHHNGILFYRSGLFEDQIILDQQWVIDQLYVFLDRKREHYALLKQNGGVLQEAYLPTLWPNYTEEERQTLISFITSSEIGFRISSYGDEEAKYLIPQLLPDQDEAIRSLTKLIPFAFRLRIDFPFLHRAIIDCLMVRLRKFDLRGKSRNEILFFAEKDVWGYVGYQEDEGSRRSILVQASNHRLGEQLRNEIGKLVALDRCTFHVSRDGVQFFPLEEVRKAWRAGGDHFYSGDQKYEVAPFRPYLHTDDKARLFENEIDRDLENIDPQLRYATRLEQVIRLVEKGQTDKAVQLIGGARDEASLLVFNFNSVYQDFKNELAKYEDYRVARAKFAQAVQGGWGG